MLRKAAGLPSFSPGPRNVDIEILRLGMTRPIQPNYTRGQPPGD
jgi:hypothetical protein